MSITVTTDSVEVVSDRAKHDRSGVTATYALEEGDPVGLLYAVFEAAILPEFLTTLRSGKTTLKDENVSLSPGDGQEQLLVVQESTVPEQRLSPQDCPTVQWYLSTKGPPDLPPPLEQYLRSARLDWWEIATAWLGYKCTPGRDVSVDLFIPIPIRLPPPESTEHRIDLKIDTSPLLMSKLHFAVRTRRADKIVQSFLPPVEEFISCGEDRGLSSYQWTKLLDIPLEPNDTVRVEASSEGDVISFSQWSQFSTAKLRLDEIAVRLREGGLSPQMTVRSLLQWFGAQRRGTWIVKDIRRALARAGLRTEPDFESAWIDGQVSFTLGTETRKEELASEVTPPRDSSGEGVLSTPEPATVPTTPVGMVAPADSVVAPIEGRSLVGPEPALPSTLGNPSPAIPTQVALVNSGPDPTVRTGGGVGDPTHRISKLAAANRRPTSVKPDSTLTEVATIMLEKDFSQLPVMPTEREVKGVVSWHSIGARLALGQAATLAREAMDGVVEVGLEDSIFSALPKLVDHGYVLVRGPENKIVGIVTASDLNLQFQQLSEPFLLLSEIENRIRNLIFPHFSPTELAAVKDPEDDERTVDSVDDLTFGEYVRLLEKPENWDRLSVKVDRKSFVRSLENIGRIRNEVMHFDPDNIAPPELASLRDFAQFLRRLEQIGVVQTALRAQPSGA